MPVPTPIQLLLINSILILAGTAVVQKANSFEAGNIVLYNSSSISMPNSMFTVTLKRSYPSTRHLAFGINNYKLGDRFAYENFDAAPNGVNANFFQLYVTSVSTTNVRTFSISYIVSGIDEISAEYQGLITLGNISSGSGDRYIQVYYTKSFPSINVLALPFITGYYITSGTADYFKYTITAQVLSNINYQVTINTTSTCLLQSVAFYMLFCQTNNLTSQGYFYQGGQDLYSSTDVNSASYTAEVDHYNDTEFILGLRGFEGFTALSGCFWGWSLANISGNTATLIVDKNQLQRIQFSFFQMGKYVVSQSTTKEEGGSPIGVIIGLIAGIVILAIAIVLFLRFYWRRGLYNVPTNDFFKEMPSLSL